MANIPADILLALLGLLCLLFVLFVWMRQRRGRRVTAVSPATTPQSAIRRITVYVLRLTGFALVSFIIIAFLMTIYLNIRTVIEETAPAPSLVEIPDDLAFPVEEITFTGGDDLALAGWYVPPQNDVVIILLHGYGGNRTGNIWHAEQLYKAGYGLLLYDQRASGESEGDHRSYGWEDPADVAAAMDYVHGRADANNVNIGIVGCSIGGQIAVQSAAQYPDITAVWADGTSSVRADDIPPSDHPLLFLVRASNYLLDWLFAQRLNMEPPPALIEQIGHIEPRPVMLVAGGQSHPLYGSESLIMHRYATYAGEHTAVWVIEEAYHCDGPAHRPDEYAERMVDFFAAAFADAAK
ncbi:MAG: alpha/beta fold hydrolase [Anaerolineae bacterium]|nr:alpha/beta fold hydrolase [Anaerolineae bacterium]